MQQKRHRYRIAATYQPLSTPVAHRWNAAAVTTTDQPNKRTKQRCIEQSSSVKKSFKDHFKQNRMKAYDGVTLIANGIKLAVMKGMDA